LMMRSASPSRSNFSRHICGPAKSQGRSPIRVDRRHHPVAYLLLTRSRCGLLAGPSWVERRHSHRTSARVISASFLRSCSPAFASTSGLSTRRGRPPLNPRRNHCIGTALGYHAG
jgi:hypothetical protein